MSTYHSNFQTKCKFSLLVGGERRRINGRHHFQCIISPETQQPLPTYPNWIPIRTLWIETEKILTQDEIIEYERAFNDLIHNHFSGFPVRLLYPDDNILNWNSSFQFHVDQPNQNRKLCVRKSIRT